MTTPRDPPSDNASELLRLRQEVARLRNERTQLITLLNLTRQKLVVMLQDVDTYYALTHMQMGRAADPSEAAFAAEADDPRHLPGLVP